MSMNRFKILSEKPAATIISASMIERRMDAGCFQPTYLKNESNLLNGKVPHARLGSLYSKGNYGSLPDSVDYATEGVALIRGTDLKSMAIDLSEAIRVPESYYDQFKKAQITPGDILMLVKGASIDRPDSVAMFPETDDKGIANGSVFIIRAKESKINSKYLLAVMTSDSFLLQKRRGSSNTGALYNDLDTIKSFIIPLPDQKIQEYIGQKVEIAEKCRAISIEYKNKANEIFLNLFGKNVSAIKKEGINCSWVNLDKLTLLRLDSRYYSPQYLKDEETLSDPSLNKILLGEMAELVKDGPGGWAFKSSEYTNKGVPVIRASDIKDLLDLTDAVYLTNERHEDLKQTECLPGDLVISVRGTPGRSAIIPTSVAKANINAAVVRVRLKSTYQKASHFLAFYLNSPLGRRVTERIANGAVQNNINLTEVKSIPIPLPEISVRNKIAENVRKWELLQFFSKQFQDESKQHVFDLLKETLDTEAIMSGKLKAPTWEDIEKELEGI